jgi:Flp pilus assembly pilin Flp
MLRSLVADEDGAAAVEYAIMLTLIIVVCVSTIGALGINTKLVCDAVCSAFSGS